MYKTNYETWNDNDPLYNIITDWRLRGHHTLVIIWFHVLLYYNYPTNHEHDEIFLSLTHQCNQRLFQSRCLQIQPQKIVQFPKQSIINNNNNNNNNYQQQLSTTIINNNIIINNNNYYYQQQLSTTIINNNIIINNNYYYQQ